MDEKCRRLSEVLKILPQKHRLISVVGAGGKTTLIYLLAKELCDAGYQVAVTTTTHMLAEERYGFTPIGLPCEDGKIKGISSEFPEELLREYDIVLVEADGSKRLPMKVPAEHEPVIPKQTDLVIAVAGASAIGKTFQEACHRSQIACAHLGCEVDDQILLSHLVEVLTSEDGQKKGVNCEYRYVINQIDRLADTQREELDEIMRGKAECGCMISLCKLEERYL